MGSKSSSVSRRGVLKAAGAAAIAGGASALLGSSPAAAAQGAPAVLKNAQGGRKFRGFVKFNTDAPLLQTLTLRPLTGRYLLIRPEAVHTCYSNVELALVPGNPIRRPEIVGHTGTGIVEAIGPQVIRTRVGDRVLVPDWSACGSCFNCLRMRSDKCLIRSVTLGGIAEDVDAPTCDMEDGTPVITNRSGMTELMIVLEEEAVPIFTDLQAPEVSLLGCVSTCGLGMTMTNVPVEVASDVVIFGAGPVGLSAVQGARIKGATRIIVVEPIPYRRELALKLGATAVVDPNQYNERKRRPGAGGTAERYEDSLVEHLRDICKLKTDRLWAGGGRVGPDHVIEAVGGDRLKPKEPQGPDPSGVSVLQQCWDLCSSIGTLATSSVGHPTASMVEFPAAQWADGAKHHWPGTAGGTNPRRDVPRFITLMESGQLNLKALVGRTYPLSQIKEAFQVVADRTVITTVVMPNA